MNTAKIIYEQVKALPEPVALEILDFVEFVRGKTISPLTNGPTGVAAASHWPKIVLDYQGEPGFTPFEAGLPEDTQRGWRLALYHALSDGEKPPTRKRRPRPVEQDVLNLPLFGEPVLSVIQKNVKKEET